MLKWLKEQAACMYRFLRVIKIWCYGQILELYQKERQNPSKKRNLIIFVSDKFPTIEMHLANYSTGLQNFTLEFLSPVRNMDGNITTIP